MQAIWDSIAPEAEATELTDAQKAEIDRRLAAHRANPKAAIPWEQTEAEAPARLPKMSLPIRFLPEARKEFNRATDWYADRDADLAKDFVARVRGLVKRVAANPKMHHGLR